MKLLFFLETLETGGAQRQIAVLAKGLANRGHSISIAVMFSGGSIYNEIKETNAVNIVTLWSAKNRFFVIRIFQLALAPFLLRRFLRKKDCLYSMLDSANFIAWLATRLKKRMTLIWGIRSSNMEGFWKMALFDKLCAWLSPTVKLVIANSFAGLKELRKRGYRSKQMLAIPNGIDTDRFVFDNESRRRIRDELGVSAKTPLVGVVGRINEMKGYSTFLDAAAQVSANNQHVRYVCVGSGSENYENELYSLADKLGLHRKLMWLGDRADVSDIYSALDILVSPSFGEGFSNVIGEAMACGVPCIATDVGDSATIVGDTGIIVEARNSGALARGILSLVDTISRQPLNKMAIRNRIMENFSVDRLLDRTEEILSHSV